MGYIELLPIWDTPTHPEHIHWTRLIESDKNRLLWRRPQASHHWRSRSTELLVINQMEPIHVFMHHGTEPEQLADGRDKWVIDHSGSGIRPRSRIVRMLRALAAKNCSWPEFMNSKSQCEQNERWNLSIMNDVHRDCLICRGEKIYCISWMDVQQLKLKNVSKIHIGFKNWGNGAAAAGATVENCAVATWPATAPLRFGPDGGWSLEWYL